MFASSCARSALRAGPYDPRFPLEQDLIGEVDVRDHAEEFSGEHQGCDPRKNLCIRVANDDKWQVFSHVT